MSKFVLISCLTFSLARFRYTSALRDAFFGADGGIASLEDLDNRGWVPGSGANAFVSNHDTERVP
jgi:hypothetical protein